MGNRHPSEAELQQYACGELGSLRSHVDSCAVCTAEVRAVKKILAECTLQRESILPGFVPPPRPWGDIYARFAEVDRERHAPWFAFSRQGWAMVAAMLVLSLGLFLRFREAPTVQAAELLRKAVAAAKPESKQTRIQVRTRTQQFLRPVGRTGANTVRSVQAQFQAAHFDWDDPLTAKAYVAWRDQLADKRDEVIRERDLYRIRTETSSGEIMTATLTLRTSDLRPVSEHLDFRNHDWVELAQAPDESAPQPVSAAPVTNHRVEQGPGPSTPPPAIPATLGDELRVFAAMHRLGADLGDPIEILLRNGRLEVRGAGLSIERQSQVVAELRSMPYQIGLFFTEPSTPKLERRDRVAPDGASNPDISQLQSRIAEQIGGRERFEEVASRVLDLSDRMMARAYALRRLAEHFPAASETELSGEEQQILAGLRRDHMVALRQTVEQMDRVLKPVLSSVSGAPPAKSGLTLSGAWQLAAERLFQTARRVDRSAAVMFGNAPDDTPGQSVPSQLLSALADLRAALESK